ncbi:MAG: hypothetical protein JW889_16580 [Verrucomicrobia bacterium]|nr:hypothetical protein [Verrucomicrobiota bacterium]
MVSPLPERPNLEHLKKQAKRLLKGHRDRDPLVCSTLRRLHRFANATNEEVLAAPFTLKEVQFALAMEYGFRNWEALKQQVESVAGDAAASKRNVETALVGNGHSDDAFSLIFAAAAKRLGRDAPYDEVVALSTNPFAPAFFLPELCPSFWHQRGRAHGLDILAGRFGVHCEELELPSTDVSPVDEPQRFREKHLTGCADIFRDAMERGCVVIVEYAWASPEGGPFVSWMWPGIVEEARADGLILGATLNGRRDNVLVETERCWALSPNEVELSDTEAARAAIERAVHRIRGDRPPFESSDRMVYGAAGVDAWIDKMHHVPFCAACVESAPNPDRARGWSCARDSATSVCEGAAAASSALRRWASDLPPERAAHLHAAAGSYDTIERLLRPFTTWDRGVGYHAMMGDLQKQIQHADGILRPVQDVLIAAADAMEKALAGSR